MRDNLVTAPLLAARHITQHYKGSAGGDTILNNVSITLAGPVTAKLCDLAI